TKVSSEPGAPTQSVSSEELGMEPDSAWLVLDGRRYELDKRRLIIGRSRECDIQVDDPNVSRRHAEIRREGAAFWVIDLGSTNGIDVNGRRRQRAKLEDGDRLTVGTSELVFALERP